MGAKTTLVPFPPSPSRRSAGDIPGTRTPVTDAERVVIRMLARRAARTYMADATEGARVPDRERR